MRKWFGYTLLIAATLSLTTATGFAQKKFDSQMTCNDSWGNDRLQNHCEIREQTLPSGGTIDVDAGQNGGVAVKGWDKNEVLVRSRVQTSAPTLAEAEALAKQVIVQTGGLRVRAEGPASQRDYGWWVSYELYVPRHSDLMLASHNGGIAIVDVNGKMEFRALNGGVALRGVGGNVHGSTTNGGLAVELSGDRWDGEQLDVRTTNGGVSMTLPENYSAHLETSTVNGSVNIDFPITVQGRITKEISVNLGSGGPLVRAVTTNGGIRVKRAGLKG